MTLIFDRSTDLFADTRAEIVVLGPPTSHTPSICYWNEVPVTRWLAKHKPDVYFSPDGFIPLRSRVPCVPVVHDIAPLVYPQHMRWRDYLYYRAFQYKMIRRAPLVFTVSEFSKNEIATKCKHIDANKIYVAYNGLHSAFRIHPSKIVDIAELNIRQPYFLYYGSIHPRKNIHGLIKSFEIYRDNGGQSQLVICGRKAWKSKSVEEVIAETHVKDAITWLSYLDNEELHSVLLHAQAVVYISHYEGFGLPVLEAMATGVPVITSSDSPMEEIGGEAVITCHPLDHQAVANSMQLLEDNTVLRDRLITMGREQAKKFNYGESAEQIVQILREKL